MSAVSALPNAASGALLLERVHGIVPDGRVSLGWLHRELDTQATTLLIFVLALLGALPGASLPAGLAICALAARMMLSRDGVLPASLAAREIAAGPARYALRRAIAVMRVCERVLPAGTELSALRPVAGALLFVLGALLLVPIPLSNVLPALAAATVALALVAGSLPLFVVSSLSAVGACALMGVALFDAIARF